MHLFTNNKGTGKLNFDSFYSIAANFLEEEDDEAMLNELKEAFRLYDKEGILFNYYF
jgi:Ca2+-binding EF-hand superfamily protein